MKRRAIGALACALALQAGTALSRPVEPEREHARETPEARESGQPVLDWNRVLVSIARAPGAQPATVHPTRSFAILHAAIFDAVRAIDRSREPYLLAVRAGQGASETAAADAAAHAALVELYPARREALDADYAAELARVPDGPAKDEGVRVGEEVARDLLAIRAADGSELRPPPFASTCEPGDFRPTPPSFAAPKLTGWGQVTPFVLDRGDQLRPAAPPPLTSDAYAAAIDEVKRLGSATSTTRTADQTEAAIFWGGPIQINWNEIAQTLAAAHPRDLPETARLFAALNLGLADAAIASFDAKYAFRRWRPITAIRLARAGADPGWTPLRATPADPSYPSAHSVLSATGAEVLTSFFGDQEPFTVTSESLPGVTRSFQSLSAAAEEAGLSRIYAGVHTRLDHEAGAELGHAVAGVVLREALQPARCAAGPGG